MHFLPSSFVNSNNILYSDYTFFKRPLSINIHMVYFG
nr:MAG TPA: hypothetical protein [Caudoviricetes sp.]